MSQLSEAIKSMEAGAKTTFLLFIRELKSILPSEHHQAVDRLQTGETAPPELTAPLALEDSEAKIVNALTESKIEQAREAAFHEAKQVTGYTEAQEIITNKEIGGEIQTTPTPAQKPSKTKKSA